MRDLGMFTAKTAIVTTAVMTAFSLIIIIPTFLLLGLLVASIGGSASNTTVFGPGSASHTFLAIPVKGIIEGTQSESSDPFGLSAQDTAYGYAIKKKLYQAAKDNSVDGIMLDIDSPGGTIYGSRAIADGVAHYKQKTNKPVYAFISGLGASGGYWAAASADKIIVDYGSTVGSIGVISGPFKFYDRPTAEDGGILTGGVVTQNGIETVTLTAGKSKDIGNPYRRLTQSEISALQAGLNNEYEDFVSYVSQRRGIDQATLRDQIGALIYDSRSATAARLTDVVAPREEAYGLLADAAAVPRRDFNVVETVADSGTHSLATTLLGRKQETPKASLCGESTILFAFYGSVDSLCKT